MQACAHLLLQLIVFIIVPLFLPMFTLETTTANSVEK